MLSLFREQKRFFVAVTILAIVLRLGFIFFLPFTEDDDTAFYAEIAKNIVTHHQYAQDGSDGPFPTLARLPGYPAFLAFVFWIFGADRYRPVLFLQMLFDIGTCLLLADLARRLFGDRAARWTYLLAAVCPFTLVYVSTALTECLEIFFTVLAFHQLLLALQERKRSHWIACGAATAPAILLRPDGGLVLIAALIVAIGVAFRSRERLREVALGAVLMTAVSLVPLVPWAIRNWRVFHVFQPLVSQAVSNPDEFVPRGWNRWMKTWLSDFSQITGVSWSVGAEDLEIQRIPSSAFDNAEERARVQELFADYNAHGHEITPELDAQFAEIANASVHRHPLRYYLMLPFTRAMDMWFHARTEAFQLGDHDWDDNARVVRAFTIFLVVLNAVLVLAAIIGWYRSRATPYLAVLWVFVVARTVALGAMGVCEQRYTVECIPFVLIFAAQAIALWRTPPQNEKAAYR